MRTLSTWTVTWRLIRQGLRPFALYALLWWFFLASALGSGLVDRAFFDRLSGARPVGLGLWWLLAALAVLHIARMVAFYAKTHGEETFRYVAQALLRRNIIANLLRRPGALPLPVEPGDALDRLEADVAEVADFPSWLPDVIGRLSAAVFGAVAMALIDPVIALVAILPLAAALVVGYLTMRHFVRYWKLTREASGAVTSFLAEVLDAVQAIKIADAEVAAAARLQALNDVRRRAEIRSSLLRQLLDGLNLNISHLSLAAVLLVAAGAMARGSFGVGDLALFAAYVPIVMEGANVLGGFISDFRTQAVSISRMLELQPNAPAESLVAPAELHLKGPHLETPSVARRPSDRLATIQVTGLSYRHPESGRGIEAVDLRLARGALTIVTGPVGAGKTTLLRVMLGLLPRDAGEIRWNGETVDDPASFFQPPRSAYVPQAPVLFSESLRENVLMGLREDAVDLPRAIWTAVLDRDVAELADGLDTLVGPRGVRLSGGQVQRAAAARMLVRLPELLVFDDLSSALDVETEATLWDRLLDGDDQGPPTCLAVSHRRGALRRADQVVVLDGGRVVGSGALDELLETCAVLQRIWGAGER